MTSPIEFHPHGFASARLTGCCYSRLDLLPGRQLTGPSSGTLSSTYSSSYLLAHVMTEAVALMIGIDERTYLLQEE